MSEEEEDDLQFDIKMETYRKLTSISSDTAEINWGVDRLAKDVAAIKGNVEGIEAIVDGLQELVSHAEGLREELRITRADLVRAQASASSAIIYGMCAIGAILALCIFWRS